MTKKTKRKVSTVARRMKDASDRSEAEPDSYYEMMAHSNKPQPDYSVNGSNPYGSYEEQCAAYALLNPEARAQEELDYELGADRYDGFDVGDLNNPSAWDDGGSVTLSAPVLPPPPVVDADDEDTIRF